MKRTEALRYRSAILHGSESLEDGEAMNVPMMFPRWEPDTAYTVGDRVCYEDVLYKAVQSHTSQADWTPDLTPALWTRVSIEEFPEWVQPTGAQDAYMKGDKVTYEGKHYVSVVDNNVWAPTTYGWEET